MPPFYRSRQSTIHPQTWHGYDCGVTFSASPAGYLPHSSWHMYWKYHMEKQIFEYEKYSRNSSLHCSRNMRSASVLICLLLVKSFGTNAFLHKTGQLGSLSGSKNKQRYLGEPQRTLISNRKMKPKPSLDLEIAPLLVPATRPIIPPAGQIIQGSMIVASVAMLTGYHILLFRAEKLGKPSWRSSQAQIRQEWAAHVRSTEGWLYAVQTLRNAITANTFLATTVLSLLTLISGKLWEMVQSFDSNSFLQYTNVVGKSRNLLVIQFASIALCMLSSAYEFLQAARLMTHAGFMFPVAKGDKVDRIMRKSQNAQWLGLRMLYVSLACICWVVGGERGFLASSLALLQFFRNIDRVPKGAEQEDF